MSSKTTFKIRRIWNMLCRQGPSIIDPLGNGSPALHIYNQKVSLIEESQEVGMKWGLGRSTSFHTSM